MTVTDSFGSSVASKSDSIIDSESGREIAIQLVITTVSVER